MAQSIFVFIYIFSYVTVES